ncbi:hypothetical protein [Polaribacter sp. Z022]|uniref:hypothetical protein n=1 Tax=Polaribacter sp. Z022 TaxID=2927125 RepID=UPI002020C9AD|nr:hypothetical protein [Polaribacter sp. Z022]MCL7754283.1 hypothetical protein [Polaribacter sp. Z022]
MKKLIVFLSILSLFSCSTRINEKDLQGIWYYNFKENDNNNLSEVVIRKDSITLIDYLYFIKKGTYKLKNDSIIINLKNEVLRKKINVTDSSLILNTTSFRGAYKDDNINYKEYNLVNLNSVRKFTAEDLSEHQGSFLLVKENDSVKIRLWNKYVSFEEYIDSTPIHFEKIGHVALLGDNFSLRDLKTVFLEMYYYNFGGLRLVTNTDFHNYNYDVFFIRTDVWQTEASKYILDNRIEKREIPSLPDNFSKEQFIEVNSPFLLEINSKQDISKLDRLKANSTYLISINIELSIENYLILWQKINRIRKEKNLKIRTEIIEFL